jgi:hypothetical protein
MKEQQQGETKYIQGIDDVIELGILDDFAI